MTNILCLIGVHNWKPLQYKLLELMAKPGHHYSRVTDKRVSREYCIRCGKIRNLIEFEGSIVWKEEDEFKKPQKKE